MLEHLSVRERIERILRLRPCAEPDRRPGTVPQLEVARYEIGVKMRQDHARDREPVLFANATY